MSCVISVSLLSNSALLDAISFFIKRSSFKMADRGSDRPPSSGVGSFLLRSGYAVPSDGCDESPDADPVSGMVRGFGGIALDSA